MLWNWKFTKNTLLWKITKLTFASSFVVNEFFESRYVGALVKEFSHASAFMRHVVSVFKKLNVFGKQLFIEVTEGSNILTLLPTTAFENVQLSFFNL